MLTKSSSPAWKVGDHVFIAPGVTTESSDENMSFTRGMADLKDVPLYITEIEYVYGTFYYELNNMMSYSWKQEWLIPCDPLEIKNNKLFYLLDNRI